MLNNKVLKDIYINYKYENDKVSKQKVGSHFKILLEIMLLTWKVTVNFPKALCDYQFPTKLIEISKAYNMLKDSTEFKMLTYMLFYQKHLDNFMKQKLDVHINNILGLPSQTSPVTKV